MTKSQIIRRYLAHLGIILCHLSILGIGLIVGTFFAGLLSVFIFLLGLIIIVGTLGIVFLVIPDYWSKLTGVMDTMSNIMETSANLVPTIAIISAVCCVASIVLTALDIKWEKARTRLIISSVMVGIFVVLVVGLVVGAIGGAA